MYSTLLAKILAMACNEDQDDLDAYLFQVDYAYNNSAQASLPMKYTSDAYRARPIAVFVRFYGGSHQSLECDHLAYRGLDRERQQSTCELVREQHALTVARVNMWNSTLLNALLREFLILGNLTSSPSAPDRINSCVSTQPRATSPAPKVNITSREPTESSLTVCNVFALYPPPYVLEPPIWYHSVDCFW